ncbi:MAG: hypothetical protein R6V11_10505 [Ectothiorhodospiraceae bacterium]
MTESNPPGPAAGQTGRFAGLAVTALSLILAAWGQAYGAAELPHTAACLTVILPLAAFGWLLRSPLPAAAGLVLVAAIQWTA